jgi:Lrp/AsnC family transcriptional regulator for asnA, asnC and gidA
MIAVPLDDIDLKIVRTLQQDGRTSYSDISKVVGVSAATVRNRINQMRSSGVLSVNVWLDPNLTGFGIHATLLLKVRSGHLGEVADALSGLEETGYVATLAGAYDAVADVFCRDTAHLRLLIHDKVQKIAGVVDVTTNVVTENRQQLSAEATAIAPPMRF